MQVFATGKGIAVSTTPTNTASLKLKVITKLTTILLFIASLHVRAHGVSQNTTVTLKPKNATLEEVLNKCQTQANKISGKKTWKPLGKMSPPGVINNNRSDQ